MKDEWYGQHVPAFPSTQTSHDRQGWERVILRCDLCVVEVPFPDAVLKAEAGRTLTVERGATHACYKYTWVVCCTVESPIEIMGRALGAESIGWPFFPL